MSEFNLVCGTGWLLQLANACFFGGVLLGCILFQLASGRFGKSLPIPFRFLSYPLIIPFTHGGLGIFSYPMWCLCLGSSNQSGMLVKKDVSTEGGGLMRVTAAQRRLAVVANA